MRFPTMCDQQSLRSACAYAQSDQSLSSRFSLHLSKCQIVRNLMHWLIKFYLCLNKQTVKTFNDNILYSPIKRINILLKMQTTTIKYFKLVRKSLDVLSFVHIHNIHAGVNIHPVCKFAPGVYFGNP